MDDIVYDEESIKELIQRAVKEGHEEDDVRLAINTSMQALDSITNRWYPVVCADIYQHQVGDLVGVNVFNSFLVSWCIRQDLQPAEFDTLLSESSKQYAELWKKEKDTQFGEHSSQK